ncbi:Mariner Mos1 transposase [Araneus ventricosus]|uniref:Mariner Mos1 transposase n=1 Tax=Araneus ventricosus TaxID=182803 RepID=A0A4Y2MNQ9_ARAVE|nr:Mariner Mos1 transposase [Araneus ventricosus]
MLVKLGTLKSGLPTVKLPCHSSHPEMCCGGLVVRSRLQSGRVPGSKLYSTEDPPWFGGFVHGHQGLLPVDFHTRGATVNVASYCATLDWLHKAIRRNRPGLFAEGVLLLHNSRPHSASVIRDLKQCFLCSVLEYPPYSPDHVPSDFDLFGQLKKHLEGRHFRTDTEVQEAIVKWLRDLDPDFFYAGFDKLVCRWHKCFNNHDDYVEK